MKNFNFLLQAKGGVGKSFLTFLIGLKNATNKNTLFVDIDQSNKTSYRQLAFLKNEKRIAFFDFLNAEKKLQREKFVRLIQDLIKTNFTEFFIDFGGNESTQIITLLENDKDSFEFLEHLIASKKIAVHFRVVIAGGTSFADCITFLESTIKTVKSEYITVYVNEHTFLNNPTQKNDIKTLCKKDNIKIVPFGNVEYGTETEKKLKDMMTKGTNPLEIKDDEFTVFKIQKLIAHL